MSRKVVPGEAFRAFQTFTAPAHERSKQSKDEHKKWPSFQQPRPLFQIARIDSESHPQPPNVRVKIRDRPRRHSPISAIPLSDAWIRKNDVDGDGGRREFGLRGQRPGRESDKGTAANSPSGYRAPGLKKILAYLRP
jgi:hypothetical protein